MTGLKLNLTILTIILILATPIFGGSSAEISYNRSSPSQAADVDLRIAGSVSPASVAAGEQVTYTYTVTNQSNTPATDVILLTNLEVGTFPVSAGKSVSGCTGAGCESCERGSGNELNSPAKKSFSSRKVLCNLGDINAFGSVVVTIVAEVSIFGNGVSTQTYPFETLAEVTAEKKDSDMSNNSVRLSFEGRPSMNKPPFAKITAPAENTKYYAAGDGTATIPVKVTASDSDGAIGKVEIYDTGYYAGTAVSDGHGNYVFSLKTSRFGYHIISATAVDNENREGDSQGNMVVVNANKISIVSPSETLIEPGTSQTVEARSDLPPDQLVTMELYDNGIFMGLLKPVSGAGGNYLYRFNWTNIPKGRHSLRIRLTNLTGAQSFSDQVDFITTKPPTVSITSLKNGAVFPSGSTIELTAEVGDADGYVDKPQFIANETSIGSVSRSIKAGQASIDWIPRDVVSMPKSSVTMTYTV